jgi:hypothetical protein
VHGAYWRSCCSWSVSKKDLSLSSSFCDGKDGWVVSDGNAFFKFLISHGVEPLLEWCLSKPFLRWLMVVGWKLCIFYCICADFLLWWKSFDGRSRYKGADYNIY